MTQRGIHTKKGLDAFQSGVVEGIRWTMGHTKIMITLLVLFVLGGGTYGGIYFYTKSKTAKRVGELAKIDLRWTEELTNVQNQRQPFITELQSLRETGNELSPLNKKGNAAEKPKDSGLSPEAKKAKIAELELKINALKPNYSVLSPEYEAFFRKHQKTPEGWAAGLRAATGWLRQGEKQDEAKSLLDALLAQSESSSFYQFQARQALVVALEMKGDYKLAAERNEESLKYADKSLVPGLLLNKYRLQKEAGNTSAAQESLEQILKDHSTSAEADKARALKILSAS